MIKLSIQERKAALIEELKELGIAQVVITYDGSGDSGAVESIVVYTAEDLKNEFHPGQDIHSFTSMPEAKIVEQVTDKLLNREHMSLYRRLERFAYDAIEASNLSDWCNNDGGGGVMTVCMAEGVFDSDGVGMDVDTISIRHFVRYTSCNYEEAVL